MMDFSPRRARRRRRFGTATRHPSLGRKAISFESLEQRQLLTAAPGTAVLENGVLTVCGTDAADTIIVADRQDDYFVAANFLTSIQLFPKADVTSIRVLGGEGDDTLVATSLNEPATLQGENGADRIFAGLSNDRLEGGAGDDLIFGNRGADVILGGSGVDRVFAGDGNDIVNGGDDNDRLQGNGGDDLLNGDAGDDQLLGSGGNDTVNGGVGNDTLLGGAGNDRLWGNAGNDLLVGEGDHDELFGEDGDDRLLGSGGNDSLVGGSGQDRLVGGNGDDFLNGLAGMDELFGDSGTDLIIGGSDADTMYGGTGPDTILGNGGNDQMYGGLGWDVLVGHGGADTLFGGIDFDILIGGADADRLFGQGGEDLLIGGITNNQSNIDALNQMRAAWTSSDGFDDRLAAALEGLVVYPESPSNQLTGGTARDAFYPVTTSEVADKAGNEPMIGQELWALNDTYEAAIGETITIEVANSVVANDLVPGGGSVAVSLITPPLHGDVTLNPDGTFSYTQSTHGRDVFEYEILNGTGQTSRATVRIVVPGLPSLPAGAFLTTTASGLQVFDFTVGDGAMPVGANTVSVGYVGYLPDGRIFDSNSMISFPLGNLIDGFTEGVEGMRVGGVRRIVIPPELGYGPGGNPRAGIGGTDFITFDVTLHAIVS